MAERVAVVTGVSKGLGASLAAALVARGVDVVGVGRSADARLTSPRFRLVRADFAESESLPAILNPLFADVAARQPDAIAVVNNAATAEPIGPVGRLEAGEATQAFRVNLVAPLIVADAFVRAFAGVACDRRLINVSSGAAVQALAGAGVYCIAKGGLEMLTQVVAAESSGIVAITLRPGVIDTSMQVHVRSQTRARLPSVDLFRGFHEDRQLLPPDVVAAKVVERLVLAPVEPGRVYSYAEL